MKAKTVCVALFAAALSVSIVPAGKSQTKAGTVTVITKLPFTISAPGEYQLDRDLALDANQDAIEVLNTANVIINLNGHTLANHTTGGTGIAVQGSDFVTVKNGTIFGFGWGVNLDANSDGSVIKGVTVANASIGVNTAADKTTIEHCIMIGTGIGAGIALSAPDTTGVVARGNQIDGFSYGVESNTGSESLYNYNHISGCYIGLSVYSTDKYKGNVFTGCSINVQQAN
jgi:hypothetical protein